MRVEELLHLLSEPLALTPENKKLVPEAEGFYVISNANECLWVGRSDNLRRRIFTDHYSGGNDEYAGSDLIRIIIRDARVQPELPPDHPLEAVAILRKSA